MRDGAGRRFVVPEGYEGYAPNIFSIPRPTRGRSLCLLGDAISMDRFLAIVVPPSRLHRRTLEGHGMGGRL